MLERPGSLAVWLVLAVGLGGCVDGVGVGSDCAAEMLATRVAEGGSPDRSQRTELGGNFTEFWSYDDSGRTYTFRWGPAHSGCEVDQGGADRIPAGLFVL